MMSTVTPPFNYAFAPFDPFEFSSNPLFVIFALRGLSGCILSPSGALAGFSFRTYTYFSTKTTPQSCLSAAFLIEKYASASATADVFQTGYYM